MSYQRRLLLSTQIEKAYIKYNINAMIQNRPYNQEKRKNQIFTNKMFAKFYHLVTFIRNAFHFYEIRTQLKEGKKSFGIICIMIWTFKCAVQRMKITNGIKHDITLVNYPANTN